MSRLRWVSVRSRRCRVRNHLGMDLENGAPVGRSNLRHVDDAVLGLTGKDQFALIGVGTALPHPQTVCTFRQVEPHAVFERSSVHHSGIGAERGRHIAAFGL